MENMDGSNSCGGDSGNSIPLWDSGAQKNKPTQYSVILYQNADNEWQALTEGIVQAEDDLHADVSYVYLSRDDTAQIQAEAVRKEIESGAAGLLIAAADSEAFKRELAAMSLSVPVIFVETGAGNSYPVIRADDYAMGKALGEEILRDMPRNSGRNVVILTEYMERDSVRLRYEGLREVLENAEVPVVIQERARQEGDYNLKLFVETIIKSQETCIAALDKYTTEQAASAWAGQQTENKNKGSKSLVYGIGSTDKTVTELDNENIRALVYQNEFNIGYQGLNCLMENRKKDWIYKNIEIMFCTVTKDTLYEDENEWLLFPNT